MSTMIHSLFATYASAGSALVSLPWRVRTPVDGTYDTTFMSCAVVSDVAARVAAWHDTITQLRKAAASVIVYRPVAAEVASTATPGGITKSGAVVSAPADWIRKDSRSSPGCGEPAMYGA